MTRFGAVAVLLAVIICLLTCHTVNAGFHANYPRFKPRSLTASTVVVELRLDGPGYGEVLAGCAVLPDAFPYDPVTEAFVPTAGRIFDWVPWHDHVFPTVVYAENVTAVGEEVLEVLLIVSASEQLDRDFEVFCAHEGMTVAEIKTTHLHLQLESHAGEYTWLYYPQGMHWSIGPSPIFFGNSSVINPDEDVAWQFEPEFLPTGTVDMLVFELEANGRANLLDFRLRTSYAEKQTYSVTLHQKRGSDAVIVGFTDGTNFWGIAMSDTAMYPLMDEWEDPLSKPALGASLNPFGIDSTNLDDPEFTITLYMSRVERVVELRVERGGYSAVYPVSENQRDKFINGPMRCVVHSTHVHSEFRFFRINGTVTLEDDHSVFTQGWDEDGQDLFLNADASASSPLSLSGTTLNIDGGVLYSKLLDVPLSYTAREHEYMVFHPRLDEHWDVVVSYGGSTVLDRSNIIVGVSNGTFTWAGQRTYTLLQGMFFDGPTTVSGPTTAPTFASSHQIVSQDDVLPFDTEFYTRQATDDSTSVVRGVTRTQRGWTPWSYDASLRPVGPLSVVLLAVEARSNRDEAIPFMRTSLSCVDQFRPWVELTTRTRTPFDNRTSPFTATFNEPVFGFSNDSVILTNAVIEEQPRPTSDFQAVEWVFHIRVLSDGPVTVQIAEASFMDTNNYTNYNTSTEFWYLHDSIRPEITEYRADLPAPFLSTFGEAYVNQSYLETMTFTVSFSERPFYLYDFVATTSVDVFNGFGRDEAYDPASLATYTFFVTADGDGRVDVHLPRGAVKDQARNPVSESDVISFQYDATPPTAVISAPLPRYTNASLLASTRFSANFSETVPLFDAVTDIVVLGDGGVDGGAAHTSTLMHANWTWYTFNVLPSFDDGWVNVTLPYAATEDRALNGVIETFYRFEFDATRPSVDLTSPVRFPTNHTAVLFTATFSERMLETPPDAISVSPGYAARADDVEVNGRLDTYVIEFYVNPTEQGDVTVFFDDWAMVDWALNGVQRSTWQGVAEDVVFLFDSIPPEVVITTATRLNATNPTNLLRTYTASFTEHVDWFLPDTLSVTNGIPTNVRLVTDVPRVYTFNILPSVVDEVITVHVPNNATVDVALNGVLTSNTVAVHYDAVPPVCTFFTANDDLVNGGNRVDQFTLGPITVLMSEPFQEPLRKEMFTVQLANITELIQVDDLHWVMRIEPLRDSAHIVIQMLPNVLHDIADNPNVDSTVDGFTQPARPLTFYYELRLFPGWPLWLKILVVLGPFTCCMCTIACFFYCWLKLPPLERIDSEEEDEFDHVDAIEALKAKQKEVPVVLLSPQKESPGGDAAAAAGGVAGGVAGDTTAVVVNPMADELESRDNGFRVQIAGATRDHLAAYTSRRSLMLPATTRRQRARSFVSFASSPRSTAGSSTGGTPRRATVTPASLIPSAAAATAMASPDGRGSRGSVGSVGSPQAWSDRQPSPARKKYHLGTEVTML